MVATPTIEQVEQQAERARDDFARRTKEIEDNKNLSAEGRASLLAAVKTERADKKYEVESNYKSAAKATQNRMYDRARGEIAKTEAYQPYYSRAFASDAKGLARMKQEALNLGNAIMLKAVYHAAYDLNAIGLLDDAAPRWLELVEHEYESGIRPDPDKARQMTNHLARNMKLAV